MITRLSGLSRCADYLDIRACSCSFSCSFISVALSYFINFSFYITFPSFLIRWQATVFGATQRPRWWRGVWMRPDSETALEEAALCGTFLTLFLVPCCTLVMWLWVASAFPKNCIANLLESAWLYLRWGHVWQKISTAPAALDGILLLSTENNLYIPFPLTANASFTALSKQSWYLNYNARVLTYMLDAMSCLRSFGAAAIDHFLENNELSYIIRAHEAHAHGVSLSKGAR